MFDMCQSETGRMSAKTILVIVILCIFTLFLLQNSSDVDIRFLFWKATMPRVILLILSGLTGCAVGLLLGWEIFKKKN